jgi:subtilisin family serine protease
MKRISCICKTTVVLLSIVSLGITRGTAGNSDAAPGKAQSDNSSAIVILKGAPLSTYAKTKPPQGKKIDFNSSTVKSYRAQLASLRNSFKSWLQANAPAANLSGGYDISLNAVSVNLNGVSLSTIKSCSLVSDAQYENLYYPNVEDPDLNLIQAIDAWQAAGGAANAGEGVKVAIIDTGIDIHHPCFDDAGYPNHTQLGDHRFTNNKVIAAKVFNNKTPSHGYTAEALQDHGTHVAGTVGCNYNTPAVVSGVTIPYGISGVAPRVLLGNYNIFPGDVAGARSEDILNALEAAYADGFDIANMSLGSGAHGIQDLVTVAIDNLDQANMVVAVAAGNSGPGLFTVESPGSAARALAAGASTVPHYIGVPVSGNGRIFGAAAGEFGTLSADLTAPLAVIHDNSSGLGLACDPLAAGSLTGKIALLSRGTCTFSAKISDAQAAGALAVLVVNNVIGDPISMGQDGTPNQPTIPAFMVSLPDGLALVTMDGASITISAALAYVQSANADIMADFSGQGPTDVDFRVKPDVVAPGVNVLSSIPVSFCGGAPCWAFFQGTSMATPHLAGSAAVVRGQHPAWTAAQVRSAIVNTADKGVLKNFRTGAPENDVNVVGAGRENLLSAVNAFVALDPVSVSFGAVPSGSGQTKTFSVTLNNLESSRTAYSLAVTPGDASVHYSVSPASVTLNAGQSATVTVTMSAEKGAVGLSHQAELTVSSAGVEVAHAAVYTLIK